MKRFHWATFWFVLWAALLIVPVVYVYSQDTPRALRCAWLRLSSSDADDTVAVTRFSDALDQAGLTWNATETVVDNFVTPVALVFNSLSVGVDVAPGIGNSRVITLRDDAADTTVTCTISGGTATTCLYSGDSITVAAGSKLGWKQVTSAALVAATRIDISVCASP